MILVAVVCAMRARVPALKDQKLAFRIPAIQFERYYVYDTHTHFSVLSSNNVCTRIDIISKERCSGVHRLFVSKLNFFGAQKSNITSRFHPIEWDCGQYLPNTHRFFRAIDFLFGEIVCQTLAGSVLHRKFHSRDVLECYGHAQF